MNSQRGIVTLLVAMLIFTRDLTYVINILPYTVTGRGYVDDMLKPMVIMFEDNIIKAQNSFREIEDMLVGLIEMLWG